jgi:hypothetical protein
MRRLFARLAACTAGMTPERTALIFALGFALGTFPVLGMATVLCAAAALLFRLNMPALQAVGQIVTPLQYALLLPLARVGARVLGFYPGLAGAAINAVGGWCCVCVPLGFGLYAALVFLLRCRAEQIQANTSLMTSPATTVGRSALPLCR